MSVTATPRPTTPDSAAPASDPQNSPAALFVLDDEGCLVWQNEAARSLVSADEFWERVPESERELLRSARTNSDSDSVEFQLTNPDQFLRETLRVRRDADGCANGYDGHWQDITRECLAARRLAGFDVTGAHLEILRCKLHDLSSFSALGRRLRSG